MKRRNFFQILFSLSLLKFFKYKDKDLYFKPNLREIVYYDPYDTKLYNSNHPYVK